MTRPPYLNVRVVGSSCVIEPGWLDITIANGPQDDFSARHGASFPNHRPLEQSDIDRLRQLVDLAQRMLDAGRP